VCNMVTGHRGQLTRDSDGHVETVNDHNYSILYTVVITI
jgi:hypothetical protein